MSDIATTAASGALQATAALERLGFSEQQITDPHLDGAGNGVTTSIDYNHEDWTMSFNLRHVGRCASYAITVGNEVSGGRDHFVNIKPVEVAAGDFEAVSPATVEAACLRSQQP